MKKDNRIDLKDKNGTITSIIMVGLFVFFAYLSFWVLHDNLSFETGICKNCFGPLKILNNPLPFIFFMVSYIITGLAIFKFILKSKYIETGSADKESKKDLSSKSKFYIFAVTLIVALILLIFFD